ncbi:MAG: polyprenyl synthetase family protein [Oscillospiraceae bacterium]|nr:polyprenyl synthetase family protein [Oscillospiraceae bacterium]
MDDWKQRLRTYADAAEAFLAEQFTDDLPQKRLFEAMRYSLLAGGKRIRPVLTVEFCRVCGGDWRQAVPFGCALEMIHTYSLIHDDLPCMDNDDYRRGKLTCHKVYGEAMAVLAGDALLTAAFETAAGAGAPAEMTVAVLRMLSACAGELGMVGGQVLDLEGERLEPDAAYIHRLQELKTGALLKAACQMGVLAAGGSQEQLRAAADYARAIGLAFQTQDDILDVEGDFEKLGKRVGMDEKKNTFVRLYGLARCHEIVREQTDAAIAALSPFADRAFLTELANYLAGRES